MPLRLLLHSKVEYRSLYIYCTSQIHLLGHVLISQAGQKSLIETKSVKKIQIRKILEVAD